MALRSLFSYFKLLLILLAHIRGCPGLKHLFTCFFPLLSAGELSHPVAYRCGDGEAVGHVRAFRDELHQVTQTRNQSIDPKLLFHSTHVLFFKEIFLSN